MSHAGAEFIAGDIALFHVVIAHNLVSNTFNQIDMTSLVNLRPLAA